MSLCSEASISLKITKRCFDYNNILYRDGKQLLGVPGQTSEWTNTGLLKY